MMTPGENLGREPRGHTENQISRFGCLPERLLEPPIMNNTLIIGLIVFAAILSGAFAGAKVSDRLPKHHLTDETKNLVSVSTAVVATVSALVLGLLISNANTSFTRLGGQVTALSAEILRLDHILRRYGADACGTGAEFAPTVRRA
jgi:hypothetical protein